MVERAIICLKHVYMCALSVCLSWRGWETVTRGIFHLQLLTIQDNKLVRDWGGRQLLKAYSIYNFLLFMTTNLSVSQDIVHLRFPYQKLSQTYIPSMSSVTSSLFSSSGSSSISHFDVVIAEVH